MTTYAAAYCNLGALSVVLGRVPAVWDPTLAPILRRRLWHAWCSRITLCSMRRCECGKSIAPYTAEDKAAPSDSGATSPEC